MITLRKIDRKGGRPYLLRRGFGDQEAQVQKDLGTSKWRVRLHHFVGPDDAGHHNHPFKWSFSIVLRGSYMEEILQKHCRVAHCFDECEGCSPSMTLTRVRTRVRTRRVRWFNWIPYGKYHRITELCGNVWTIFITGPRVSSWGFWVPGRGHVDHKQYKAEQNEKLE